MSRFALLALLPACLVQEVDLRTPTDPQPLIEECSAHQRFIQGRGCVHCETLEHPSVTCPCAWQFEPADLPYCDTPEAYYRCLPCTGDITRCNAYDDTTGTASDCFLLERCCEQLADDTGSTACCDAPDLVRCGLEPEQPGALVGCLPADCCDPTCHPILEVCNVVASQGELVCVCDEAIAP